MPALVECVPNFSEGRDKSRVDAIIEAMKMDGVYLLDREMDADHNRCVITLVGDPVNVAEAAIRGVGKAAELIDLTKHTGAHPRLGAADVIPFIPIEGVTLEDCVAIGAPCRRGNLEALQGPGVFVRGGGADAGAAEPGERAARAVRGHSRRGEDESGAQAGFRQRGAASDGGRDHRGRAQVSGGLQRVSQHAGRGDREEGRQRRSGFPTAACAT